MVSIDAAVIAAIKPVNQVELQFHDDCAELLATVCLSIKTILNYLMSNGTDGRA
jgi:hypothetical protein